MSQKSSLPQPTQSVSRVLTADNVAGLAELTCGSDEAGHSRSTGRSVSLRCRPSSPNRRDEKQSRVAWGPIHNDQIGIPHNVDDDADSLAVSLSHMISVLIPPSSRIRFQFDLATALVQKQKLRMVNR